MTVKMIDYDQEWYVVDCDYCYYHWDHHFDDDGCCGNDRFAGNDDCGQNYVFVVETPSVTDEDSMYFHVLLLPMNLFSVAMLFWACRVMMLIVPPFPWPMLFVLRPFDVSYPG
jgi:hypothetical protein